MTQYISVRMTHVGAFAMANRNESENHSNQRLSGLFSENLPTICRGLTSGALFVAGMTTFSVAGAFLDSNKVASVMIFLGGLTCIGGSIYLMKQIQDSWAWQTTAADSMLAQPILVENTEDPSESFA